MPRIPHLFHSLEHDGPFLKCLACERKFLDLIEPYSITKAYRGPECVFEYALCQSCRKSVASEFSQESRETIERFFEKRVDLQARAEKLNGTEAHAPWLEKCITCQTSLGQSQEYVIAAMAHGEEMLYSPYPMMVCGPCEKMIQSSLSKTTRERWDGFIRDHFPGPPADALDPAPAMF